MSEWLCPDCGQMIDTPMHELGCPTGRREKQLVELDTVTQDFIDFGGEASALARLRRDLDEGSKDG